MVFILYNWLARMSNGRLVLSYLDLLHLLLNLPPVNIITNNNNQNTTNNSNNNRLGAQNTNDDHSQHGGNKRSLQDYLHLNEMTQPSHIIFPLNIEHFEFKSGVVQLLPNFYGWTRRVSVCTFKSLKKYVPPSIFKISAQNN